MPSAFEGWVSIDGDDTHRWTLQIDDLDRANWEGIPLAGASPGGSTPAEGATCRVTLGSGSRFGQVAPAIFRETKEVWLRGLGAFISTGRVFTGGVAVFTPPARVRVRKGFIKLARNVPSGSLIAGFAPQALCWSARRGMFGGSDVGAIPLEHIALLRCDPDGSVVVAYWEGGQRGQERQLAFWWGRDRRKLLNANEMLEEIERWADDERAAGSVTDE
jgi:hypothetical protein